MTSSPAPADALRFARILFEAARDAGVDHPVFEIRAFEFVKDQGFKQGGTNSGYFDSPEALAEAALSLEERKARGVFVTLNPCDPALLARAKNRIQPRAKSTTTDAQVVHRVWLLIDVDPVRPSGISASKDECHEALKLVKRIMGELTLIDGWPEPIIASSGNGGHLLYRLDLLNDDGSKSLVKRVLEALARRFDTDAVKVDTKVYNAARISKVYGTTARKGDSLADRPHRVARLGTIPQHLEVVTREQLETLTADAQASLKEDSAGPDRVHEIEDTASVICDGYLEGFIDRHNLKVASQKRGERGQDVFVLEVCPFNSDHARDGGGGGSAVLTREARGKLGFMCQHNGCAGKNWKALRALLEPDQIRDLGRTADEVVSLSGELTARTKWQGCKLVVTVLRYDTAVHVDRVDPSSARSRNTLTNNLTQAVELEEDGCRALDQHLIGLAAAGAPSSDSDPDVPTVVDPDPDPWIEEVDGAGLLDEVVAVLSQYLILPEHAAESIALWVIHTYAYAQFRYTPRLLLTSPDKRCGKSRLVGVINALVWRPLAVEGITAAAMFRVIEAHRPTLLLDEADTFLSGRHVSEDLRGVVNAGYERGGRVLRCVGDTHEPTPFAVCCPVILAMIGRPPGTIEDRSLVVPMRRRRAGEPVARIRPGTVLRDDLEHLRSKCRRWVDDQGHDLAESDPQIPEELDDRAADHWLPLIAIADAAGGPWPDRARSAAIAMTQSRAEGDTDSTGVLLLRDLRLLFEGGGVDRLPTQDLLSQLRGMDERPWPEFGNTGRPITARQMAKLLRPFGVQPADIRFDGRVAKGYRAAALQEAWSRYTPGEDPLHATEGAQPLGEQECSGVADGEGDPHSPTNVAGQESCKEDSRQAHEPDSEAGELNRPPDVTREPRHGDEGEA